MATLNVFELTNEELNKSRYNDKNDEFHQNLYFHARSEKRASGVILMLSKGVILNRGKIIRRVSFMVK